MCDCWGCSERSAPAAVFQCPLGMRWLLTIRCWGPSQCFRLCFIHPYCRRVRWLGGLKPKFGRDMCFLGVTCCDASWMKASSRGNRTMWQQRLWKAALLSASKEKRQGCVHKIGSRQKLEHSGNQMTRSSKQLCVSHWISQTNHSLCQSQKVGK